MRPEAPNKSSSIGPMLKFLSNTEKSPSLHSRSKTVSCLQSSTADINTTALSTTTVDGLHFDFMAPTLLELDPQQQHDQFPCDSLVEPTKSHQRSQSEQVRVKTELPPLIIQYSQPSHQRDPPKPNFSTDQKEFQFSLDQSREGSPPRQKEFQFSLDQSREGSPPRQKGTSIASRNSTKGKADEKIGKLADWFKGESAPISIGILPSPINVKVSPSGPIGSTSEIRPSSLLQRSSTAQRTPKPAMASRFSFFSSKASLPKPALLAPNLGDELLDMDVSNALFPAGPPDPTSPAAFKNLQEQAERLLAQLQTAYRERTLQVKDMAAEKEALAEETEGAETRARHLKIQLDDTSVKLAEQDEAMMNLVDDLAQEKLARREEEEARKRTVRLVEHNSPPKISHRRISRANTVSDSGFESEDDSPGDSVFSRRNGAHSPTMSMSSVSSTHSPDGYQSSELHVPTTTPHAARLRIPASQLDAKGMPAAYRPDLHEEPSQSGCPNCRGVRASEAWSVLGVLREENQCLKHRIGELEGALDGCLDVVSSLS
ncbi:hypothetical protein N7G274_010320 [Stereocaulon virgatum]|uniref:GDP/GTP exchange factor Sec2 N-terminal domain-containing protein n=1 Tax=Stereocaulon virgatum TaxID=373712 RepID=A0ABR3ZVH9_9LECA